MDKSQYKDVCVFVEQREGIIQKVALELLGKARELADSLNEKVIALLLGYDMKDQAQELIAYGADIVVCVDERELAIICPADYRPHGRLYRPGHFARK